MLGLECLRKNFAATEKSPKFLDLDGDLARTDCSVSILEKPAILLEVRLPPGELLFKTAHEDDILRASF